MCDDATPTTPNDLNLRLSKAIVKIYWLDRPMVPVSYRFSYKKQNNAFIKSDIGFQTPLGIQEFNVQSFIGFLFIPKYKK